MEESSMLPGIAQALSAMETGALRARDLAERCLARLEARNVEVQAFCAYDAQRIRKQADEVDAGQRRGLLAGIPFAAKDVIHSADYPTTYGSPIYAGYQAGRDA